VSDKACNGVSGSSIGIVRSFPYEDEPFLDEGRDSIIGREEEEADCEDEEAEAVGDSLQIFFRVVEHGGHHEAHEGQNHESREEKLRGAPYVYEVAANEYPYLC